MMSFALALASRMIIARQTAVEDVDKSFPAKLARRERRL
jgi:hypothetical protein